jgi:carbonic anhydrase
VVRVFSARVGEYSDSTALAFCFGNIYIQFVSGKILITGDASMPSPAYLRTLLLPLCLLLPAAHAADAHWSYEGDQGPAHWGDLGNAMCNSGKAQSPIDVDTHKLVPQKVAPADLRISYGRSPLKAVNNGHTIQGNPSGSDGLNYKGDDYRLLQFHFHTPSEHLFNHHHYPLEMHLVNQDKDGHLLVLGVMIKRGKENAELAKLWSALPRNKDGEAQLDAAMAPDLGQLLPSKGHHLFYSGSLTTPPCSEGVQWILFEQPIEMSSAQIERFRQIFPDNHRPAQPLDGRELDED